MVKKLEVYNNGRGWRIAFEFQGAVRVLNIEQTKALIKLLQDGLSVAEEGKDSA